MTSLASKSDFGSWFDKRSAAGATAGASAPSAPAAGGGIAGGITSLFGAKPAKDVESKGGEEADGTTESSSFLPGFIRNTTLFGGNAPPPPSEWACGMSMAQRWQVGLVLLLGSGALFMVALFVFLPMVVLMPSKFASSITFASLLFMAAMAMFRGPRTMLTGLIERERLPFTAAYVLSLVLTLYATLVSQSYITIIVALAVQIAALAWYASTFIPGGTAGMSFLSRMVLSSAASSARGVAGMVVGGGSGGGGR